MLAAGFHLVDLAGDGHGVGAPSGAPAVASPSAAAAAMRAAAAARPEAAAGRAAARAARRGWVDGMAEPDLALGAVPHQAAEGAAKGGGQGAPQLSVVSTAGAPNQALGDDSEPWTPHNESDLVPELPPAIMWLLAEAEACACFCWEIGQSDFSFSDRAKLPFHYDCMRSSSCSLSLPAKAEEQKLL